MVPLGKLSRRTLILLILWRRKEARKLRKRKWVRIIFEERNTKGEYKLLIKELQLHDHEYFFKYFRMSPTRYEELLRLVAAHITKSSIRREAIGPGERLAVTLRYIFAGISQVDLSGSFRISPTSIGRVIVK